MRHRAHSWCSLLQLGLAVAGWLGASSAWSQDLPEYRVKAAFVYNFVAYTEWPSDVGTALNVCVYGPDPFAIEIDSLEGKTAGARRIDVHRKTSLEALKGCQLVFVAPAFVNQLPRVVDTVRGLPVLIVADSPGALRQGAIVNMNMVQNRVTFEANLGAARSARLTLSSKLLRLATDVIQ